MFSLQVIKSTLVITERTPSGSQTTVAIECKDYNKPVGIQIINAFAAVCYLLKSRGLVDRAILVSSNAFTRNAREAAKEHNLELLEIHDLRQRVKGREDAVRAAESEVESEQKREPSTPGRKRVLVIMPFSPEFDDIYILGIVSVAEKLEMVVERADSIENNEATVNTIIKRIYASDVVIADYTSYMVKEYNNNVHIEIITRQVTGLPTLLIARKGTHIPGFDLRPFEALFYGSIIDLRENLRARFEHILGDRD